jgi:hypothetical protein
MSDVSRILSPIEGRDAKAATQLLKLAYDEFSKIDSRETGLGKTRADTARDGAHS